MISLALCLSKLGGHEDFEFLQDGLNAFSAVAVVMSLQTIYSLE